MSELALTLVRLAFLGLLWLFVLMTVLVLRKDLRQPAETRPTGRPRQPKAPKPAKVARQAKVRGTKLVVTEGPLTGTVIPLNTAQVTIGRAPDSTVVIEDDYASSRHARVYPSEGAWVVEDLGSTNGTFVNGAKITETAIEDGGSVSLGSTTLVFRSG